MFLKSVQWSRFKIRRHWVERAVAVTVTAQSVMYHVYQQLNKCEEFVFCFQPDDDAAVAKTDDVSDIGLPLTKKNSSSTTRNISSSALDTNTTSHSQSSETLDLVELKTTQKSPETSATRLASHSEPDAATTKPLQQAAVRRAPDDAEVSFIIAKKHFTVHCNENTM